MLPVWWGWSEGVMLPENILEELTRPAPLQRQLILLAWPSLSPMERIHVLMCCEAFDWLTELALNDDHPIVRFWGASQYRGPLRTAVRDGKFVYLSREQVPLDEVGQRALADPIELVRLAVDDAPYAQASQLSRLVRIRSKARSVSLSSFVEWLGASVDEGISDGDLAECAEEYFSKPHVMRELATTERPDWIEGWDDYSYGKTLAALWRLLGKAGPQLGAAIVSRLPFRFYGHSISADVVINLPHDTIVELIKLFPERPVIAKVRDQILSGPEHFPDVFVARVKEVADLREDFPVPLGLGPQLPPRGLNDEVAELRAEMGKLRDEILAELSGLKRRRWF